MPTENGIMNGSEAAQLQITACRRCRRQKLRCTKEAPICRRCRDIGAVCDYPPPPDRKALAAKRAQTARARSSVVGLSGLSPSQITDEAIASVSGSSPGQEPESRRSLAEVNRSAVSAARMTPLVPDPASSVDQTIMPQPDVAAYLIDIYFEKMYFSTLLFHKSSFLEAYHAGKMEQSLVLSMFALSTIFMRTPANRAVLKRRSFGRAISPAAMESAASNGHRWASTASQSILMDCDQPRVEVVQGCQNLAIYWLSQGQANRTNIQQHIAYRVSRLLGLHKVSQDEPSLLQSEMDRRMFWATWISHCISQDNSTFKKDCWVDAAALPLPSDELSFEAGRPILQEAFDSNGHLMSLDSHNGNAATRKLSPLAEMAKLIGLWWEIQKLVKKYAAEGQEGSSQNVAAMQEVDHRLDLIGERLDPTKTFKVPTFGDSGEKYLLTGVHCLFHLCGCTLSSALIPLFSNVPAKVSAGIMSKKMSRTVAQTTIEHALALLAIASDFVKAGADTSRLPSLTGFSMFVACTVYFKALHAQSKLGTQALDRIRPAVIILEELQQYWDRLRSPWQSLETLLKTHGFQLGTYQNLKSGTQTPLPESMTKIDQIITHEPLPEQGSTSKIYTFHESEETVNERPRSSIAFLLDDNAPRPSPSSSDTRTSEGSRRVTSYASPSSVPDIHRSAYSSANNQIGQGTVSYQPYSPLPSSTSPAISNMFHSSNALLQPLTYDNHMMDLDGADLWWDQTFDFVTDGYQLGAWPAPP